MCSDRVIDGVARPGTNHDTEPTIDVQGLGKCYQIFDRPIDRLRQAFSRGQQFSRDFWALQDVSFTVMPGETVGIIGKNGSGKSTLLEILSGTLTPSEGHAVIRGSVSALLELGAGFNPEFTGRENVYLNGTILGLTRRSLTERMDQIVDFAEIGDHIDQPVKTYSSGMYVRLAFAVAINLDPDILVIDEALAVGDIQFQRKCYRKFDELKNSGKTILFVTHSTELVRAHCDRAVFLQNGRMIQQGIARDVIHAYLNSLFNPNAQNLDAGETSQSGALDDPTDNSVARQLNVDPSIDGCSMRRGYNRAEYRWGDGRARIIDYDIREDDKKDILICQRRGKITIAFCVYFEQALKNIIYGLTVRTVEGVSVFGTNTRSRKQETQIRAAGEVVEMQFSFTASLVPGDYFVSLGVAVDDDEVDNAAVDRRYDIALLKVEGEDGDFGLADLAASFVELETLSAAITDAGPDSQISHS